jgi:putative iron-regulated protein|tara:strand:- start:8316 stop:9773 length:1458 start_codon:yes stop_codon:yes gene_type:complete
VFRDKLLENSKYEGVDISDDSFYSSSAMVSKWSPHFALQLLTVINVKTGYSVVVPSINCGCNMSALGQFFRYKPLLLPLVAAAILFACDSDERDTPTDETVSSELNSPAINSAVYQISKESTQELITNYLHLVDFGLAETISQAIDLEETISAFLLSPTVAGMEKVRDAWLLSHNTYEAAELHRYVFKSLTKSAQDSVPDLLMDQLDYQIDHWPVLPGYIDYVEGYPESGVVSDINVSIDKDNIREQHGYFDLAEAATGYHVLEFLIWGENISGIGMRSFTDYEAALELTQEQIEAGLEVSQLSKNRRRLLLPVVAEILTDDLQEMQKLWTANKSMIANRLEEMSGPAMVNLLNEAIANMITDELLVKSLYPLLNNDLAGSIQSPYSRSTQNAVLAQLTGIEQIMREATNSDGKTFEELLARISDDFVTSFFFNFDASKECLALLYPAIQRQVELDAAMNTEFGIVECINLLNNLENILGEVSQL